jgi:DNA polymerase-1
LLFDKLGLPVLEKTETGEPSLNKHVMEQYDAMLQASDNRTAQLVVAYRGWQRSNSACYVGYPKLSGPDNRIHPSFKIFGTKTGRLSCVEPNLQQIPRRSEKAWDGQIKNLFVPSPGFDLWEFDYGQLEFRLASLYGGDATLLTAWQNGEDPYQQVADAVHITRQQAKTLVLSMLYGAGVDKIAYTLRISNSEAEAIRNNFRRTYPGLKRKMAAATIKASEQRHVAYWTGRRRHFGKFNPDEEHKAFNSVLQGGGFEIVKRAICKLLPLSSEEHRMVLTIHDSIVFEIKKDHVSTFVPEVVRIMEGSSKFKIPFKVEAKQWGT